MNGSWRETTPRPRRTAATSGRSPRPRSRAEWPSCTGLPGASVPRGRWSRTSLLQTGASRRGWDLRGDLYDGCVFLAIVVLLLLAAAVGVLGAVLKAALVLVLALI